jgi:hypothetical protein
MSFTLLITHAKKVKPKSTKLFPQLLLIQNTHKVNYISLLCYFVSLFNCSNNTFFSNNYFFKCLIKLNKKKINKECGFIFLSQNYTCLKRKIFY